MPWAQLLAAAMRLGLSPQEFWATSVAEWNLLQRGMTMNAQTATSITRDDLADLEAAYPDAPLCQPSI